MDFIAGLLGNAASGGLFGFLGAGVGMVAKYFQEKQRQKFEKDKWAYEIDLQELHMQAKEQETEQEIKLVNTEGSWAGLRASATADAAAGQSYLWVNAIKALYRPFLTTGLWVMAAWMFYLLLQAMSDASAAMAVIFSQSEIKELLQYILNTTVFTASAAGMWWFGDRAMAPPGLKNK